MNETVIKQLKFFFTLFSLAGMVMLFYVIEFGIMFLFFATWSIIDLKLIQLSRNIHQKRTLKTKPTRRNK